MLSNVYRGNPQDRYYFQQQNNVKKIKANKDQDFCLRHGGSENWLHKEPF